MHCLLLGPLTLGYCEFDWVKNVVDQAKSITKVIYSHSWIFNLMEKNTSDKELVWPSITWIAMNFLLLNVLLAIRTTWGKCFVVHQTGAISQKGIEISRVVYEIAFWTKAKEAMKAIEPLVVVLRMVDGDKTTMVIFMRPWIRLKRQ